MLTGNYTGNVNDLVCVTSARWDDGGPFITQVNDAFCRLTGYTESEVLDRNPKFLQGISSSRSVLDRLREQCKLGVYFEGRTINYKKDGTPFVMEWCINPIRGRNGSILFYYAIQRDCSKVMDTTLPEAAMMAASVLAAELLGQKSEWTAFT